MCVSQPSGMDETSSKVFETATSDTMGCQWEFAVRLACNTLLTSKWAP